MMNEKNAAARRAADWLLPLLCALSAAWAVQFSYGAAAADRGQGVTDVLLTVALYLLFLYRRRACVSRVAARRARILSAVFVLLTAVGGDWLTHMRYDAFTDVPLYVAYYLNAFVGTWLLFTCGLSLAFSLAEGAPAVGSAPRDGRRARRTFLVSFAVCAAVYFIFLLNQYPGAMESDHMRQLSALLNGVYENRNPLVNSLIVYGCVSLVTALGGSMNAGVFLYSVVQLLFLAAVFGYAVSLLYRVGCRRWAVIAALVFYAAVPYNIFYSYGMWKDSFFTGWLLLTVLKAWSFSVREKEGARVRPLDYALLFFAALMASLSRNSGWSALLAFAPCLLLIKRPFAGKAALVTGGAVAAALVLMGPVYRALGVVPTADSITAACVPLQQIGRVIVEDKPLTDEEAALIDAVADRDAIRDTFDPMVADPMKDAVYPHIETLDAHMSDYVRLWLRLGAKYPLTYFRAYKDLLRMYYDPNVSSEVAYKWVYQNDFGVYRDPKLLPGLDFGYYESWLELPALNLLKRPGAILWCLLALWQVCALRGCRRMRVWYVPFLAVYAGLFFTAPVALFRYVYSAAAALPLYFVFPFCGDRPPADGALPPLP